MLSPLKSALISPHGKRAGLAPVQAASGNAVAGAEVTPPWLPHRRSKASSRRRLAAAPGGARVHPVVFNGCEQALENVTLSFKRATGETATARLRRVPPGAERVLSVRAAARSQGVLSARVAGGGGGFVHVPFAVDALGRLTFGLAASATGGGTGAASGLSARRTALGGRRLDLRVAGAACAPAATGAEAAALAAAASAERPAAVKLAAAVAAEPGASVQAVGLSAVNDYCTVAAGGQAGVKVLANDVINDRYFTLSVYNDDSLENVQNMISIYDMSDYPNGYLTESGSTINSTTAAGESWTWISYLSGCTLDTDCNLGDFQSKSVLVYTPPTSATSGQKLTFVYEVRASTER